MSRKRRASQRKIEADTHYGYSVALSKFINMLMWDGKKSIASRVVYDALDSVAKKRKDKPLVIFNKVITDLSPLVEVKSRRVGGATYSVPSEIRESRRIFLAMGWLINAARKRGSGDMTKKLADEINDVLEERGAAIKKKIDVHKAAESSRAFSHLRF
ncbi:MAG: 30S ribosomal protein S7 [Candidatus Portiera sp.]|nr:30S ribosomal protein S7 [Portiera sp.]